MKKIDEILSRVTADIIKAPSSEYVALLRKDAIELLIMATSYYEQNKTEYQK